VLVTYRSSFCIFGDVTAEDDRIKELEAEALVRDARIAALVDEVDGLLAARENAAVIEQAKGVIMSTTRCSADAAFAVLVAASQRENVKLATIAARIAAAQGRETEST
jgi:AmiR/NasT family two-component response regulator